MPRRGAFDSPYNIRGLEQLSTRRPPLETPDLDVLSPEEARIYTELHTKPSPVRSTNSSPILPAVNPLILADNSYVFNTPYTGEGNMTTTITETPYTSAVSHNSEERSSSTSRMDPPNTEERVTMHQEKDMPGGDGGF